MRAGCPVGSRTVSVSLAHPDALPAQLLLLLLLHPAVQPPPGGLLLAGASLLLLLLLLLTTSARLAPRQAAHREHAACHHGHAHRQDHDEHPRGHGGEGAAARAEARVEPGLAQHGLRSVASLRKDGAARLERGQCPESITNQSEIVPTSEWTSSLAG